MADTGTDIQTPAHAILTTLTVDQVGALRRIIDRSATWKGKPGHEDTLALYRRGIVRIVPIDNMTARVELTDIGKQVRDAAG